MRFSAIISLGLALFTASITAIAFPDTTDDCGSCGTMITASSDCGYVNLGTSNTEPTESQVSCMCKVKDFQSSYEECLQCLVSVGQYTSAEASQMSSELSSGCQVLNGGAGCLSVGPGKMVLGAMAVGMGMYAL